MNFTKAKLIVVMGFLVVGCIVISGTIWTEYHWRNRCRATLKLIHSTWVRDGKPSEIDIKTYYRSNTDHFSISTMEVTNAIGRVDRGFTGRLKGRDWSYAITEDGRILTLPN